MIRALFEMVGAGGPAPEFTEAEWRGILAFADRTQLTLYLRGTPGLPPWLVEEIENRHARNAERRRRLRDAYAEVACALDGAGIEFVLLKGFTHELTCTSHKPPANVARALVPAASRLPGFGPVPGVSTPVRRADKVSKRSVGRSADAAGKSACATSLRLNTCEKCGLNRWVSSPGRQAGVRVQYDLDLLTLPADLAHARTVIERLGYAPHGAKSLSEEHARPLVRPSNWTWRGDYFDPDMPIPVELHGSAWSPEHDRIHPAGMEEFWNRRRVIKVDGLEVPAFAEVDRLAFAALHALRHILRHDARPAHVLELARFLEARDTGFWDQWRSLHPPQLRELQSVAFRFAHEWFGCELPAAARLPDSADRWFRHFAWSPVANLLSLAGQNDSFDSAVGRLESRLQARVPAPQRRSDCAWIERDSVSRGSITGSSKDTVWLHLALVKNWRDRVRVFCDRMIPLRLPHHESFLGRLRYHAGALAPALASGVRWWWRRDAASTASEISAWKRRRV